MHFVHCKRVRYVQVQGLNLLTPLSGPITVRKKVLWKYKLVPSSSLGEHLALEQVKALKLLSSKPAYKRSPFFSHRKIFLWSGKGKYFRRLRSFRSPLSIVGRRYQFLTA